VIFWTNRDFEGQQKIKWEWLIIFLEDLKFRSPVKIIFHSKLGKKIILSAFYIGVFVYYFEILGRKRIFMFFLSCYMPSPKRNPLYLSINILFNTYCTGVRFIYFDFVAIGTTWTIRIDNIYYLWPFVFCCRWD